MSMAAATPNWETSHNGGFHQSTAASSNLPLQTNYGVDPNASKTLSDELHNDLVQVQDCLLERLQRDHAEVMTRIHIWQQRAEQSVFNAAFLQDLVEQSVFRAHRHHAVHLLGLQKEYASTLESKLNHSQLAGGDLAAAPVSTVLAELLSQVVLGHSFAPDSHDETGWFNSEGGQNSNSNVKHSLSGATVNSAGGGGSGGGGGIVGGAQVSGGACNTTNNNDNNPWRIENQECYVPKPLSLTLSATSPSPASIRVASQRHSAVAPNIAGDAYGSGGVHGGAYVTNNTNAGRSWFFRDEAAMLHQAKSTSFLGSGSRSPWRTTASGEHLGGIVQPRVLLPATPTQSSIGSFRQIAHNNVATVEEEVTEQVPRPTDRLRAGVLKALDMISWILISLNTIYLGVELDVAIDALGRGKPVPEWTTYVDIVFTAAFLAELVVKAAIFRKAFFIGETWRWNLFDFLLVLSSLLEHFTSMFDFSFARVWRIVRVSRAVKLVRTFSWVRKLRLMIASIMSSLLSLMWAFILLFSLLYLFAVFILQGVVGFLGSSNLADIHPALLQHYGSILTACYTLFKSIAGGDDWGDLAEPLESISRTYLVAFIFFIGFVVFGILNVLTAIFVEAASQIAEVDRDLVIQEHLSQESHEANAIRHLFQDADKDGSGELTREEFDKLMEQPKTSAYLRSLRVEVAEARGFFALLDLDEDEKVNIRELTSGLMRLRGGATGVHMATAMYQNKKIFSQLTKFMRDVAHHFDLVFEALDIVRPEGSSAGFEPMCSITDSPIWRLKRRE